jgi:hypothetical protein
MMRKGLVCLVAAGLVFAITPPANAGLLGAVIGNKLTPKVKGDYRKGNQIRVTSFVVAEDSKTDPFEAALVEMARMARVKGYERFALIKPAKCKVTLMNGIAAHRSCELLGQMVAADEVAKPAGKEPVTYYLVGDLIATE